MKKMIRSAFAALLTVGIITAHAQSKPNYSSHAAGAGDHGPMMGHGMQHGPAGYGPMDGPTAMLTQQDANSSADMGLIMDLIHEHAKIRRTVTNLRDGIRTVTESDDIRVAQSIKAHVASMSGRLNDGREFNLFSTTLPVLFDNATKIKSTVEMTGKGAIVTRTSTDPKVVAALQAHAGEVTELVREGMAAMHRGMMSRMAMGPHGPRGATQGARGTGNPAPTR